MPRDLKKASRNIPILDIVNVNDAPGVSVDRIIDYVKDFQDKQKENISVLVDRYLNEITIALKTLRVVLQEDKNRYTEADICKALDEFTLRRQPSDIGQCPCFRCKVIHISRIKPNFI